MGAAAARGHVSAAMLLTVDVEPDWGAALGPHARFHGVREALPRLLDELSRRDVRATFFVVGELAEAFAQRCDPASGHEVGAHGLTHRRLPRLPPAEQQHEVTRARERLESAGFAVEGFRAPFLDAPPDLGAQLARAGYRYDASAGTLGPSLRRRALPPAGAEAALEARPCRMPGETLAFAGLPCNLTWLRLLDPAGLALLRRRPAQLSLHLHELLPAPAGLASLPWPLRRLHARSCGPRAWELLHAVLDHARDAGCRFVTCREALPAAPCPVGAA
jgi:peptidoglycan/xylan/chitin deacetylase (PgdA/CDA1 family)